MRYVIPLFCALLLAGCQTTQGPATAGALFCQTAKPIYWNAQDSRLTKEQVDTHNRVGKELCGWGKPK